MHDFTPVSALAGGALIGLASVWLLAVNGRIAGVSGILHGMFTLREPQWRAWFIAGLLLAGAALFGIGWGIAGYCPGPALTALATLSHESIVFVSAMIVGGLLHRLTSGATRLART